MPTHATVSGHVPIPSSVEVSGSTGMPNRSSYQRWTAGDVSDGAAAHDPLRGSDRPDGTQDLHQLGVGADDLAELILLLHEARVS
jgi:hypothetical protein